MKNVCYLHHNGFFIFEQRLLSFVSRKFCNQRVSFFYAIIIRKKKLTESIKKYRLSYHLKNKSCALPING
jgi:hypothetical protein